MAVFAGTSINGAQTLGFLSAAPQRRYQIHFPQLNFPTASRIGYVYAFSAEPGSPTKYYLSDASPLSIPGRYKQIFAPNMPTTWGLWLEVEWNAPNIPWVATIL